MKEDLQNKPLQILIAEDDPDDQFIFETAFKEIEPDANVQFFYTSQALIQHLIRTGIQKDIYLPDVIIGDMKVPFFELKDIAEIRTYKQFENIPVYVFAESFADVTRINALSLGANGFYHKPNSLHILKHMLVDVVKQLKGKQSKEYQKSAFTEQIKEENTPMAEETEKGE